MRLFIFCFLLSAHVFATELRTFDFYKQNFSLLSIDLDKIENLNKENSSDDLKNAIDDMGILKKHFDSISNSLELDVLLSAAQKNGWMNVLRKTKELSSSCEEPSFNIELCKSGAEELLNFSQSSNLSLGNKDFIKKFLTSFIVQISTQKVVNPTFIEKFNKDMVSANFEFNNRLNTVKTKEIPSLEYSSSFEAASIPTKNIRYSEFVAVVSVFSAALLMILVFMHFSNKKIIKNFYVKLFTVAQKRNIQLKIFGNLPTSETKFLKIFQTPLLNTIYLSKSVSNKAQINLKMKDKRISVEIHYDTSRSIQQVIGLEKEKAFKESLKVLQDMVKMNSGEFLYMNHFNSFGDIVQSGIIIHLPS